MMRLRDGLLHRMVLASAMTILSSVACSDKSPVEPDSLPGPLAEVPPAELVVSDPFLDSRAVAAAAQAVSARPSLVSAAGVEVAYVSLKAGSLPKAISVTIRNLTTGAAQTPSIPFLDGGFDPIPVVARAGDELELRITAAAGATILYRVAVAKRRPPGVVRTSPPQGMIDVALNSRVMVVFTEPVDPATLTMATVQLVQGTTLVPGTVRLVEGSLFAAEFVADEELASGTTYRLVATRGILDADGDSLEAEVATDFTTLTTGPGIRFSSIVAGWGHTCALRVDGKALCWGQNWYGQLGAGNNLLGIGTCPAGIPGGVFLCSTVPVTVVGGHTFASLASGFEHTCGVTAAGEALCWGDNGGLPGGEDWPPHCDPSREDCGCDPSQGKCSGEPVQVGGSIKFESVVAGFWHTCGIRVGAGAYCWGHELLVGGLGTGDADITPAPAAVRGGIAFTSLSSGAHHICGLDPSGSAFCWGLNLAGQLGFSGGENCSGPATSDTTFVWRCAKAPTRMSGALTFAALTAGWRHTCGLTPSGRAYCWGDYDLLFTGSDVASPRPVGENLAFVSLSSGASASHTCGVTSANVAYCWGRNEEGKLGDGTTTSTLVPVRVASGLAFSAIVVGAEHSCGITTAGALYCWGDNRTGQLGVGYASAGSLVPVRVAGQ